MPGNFQDRIQDAVIRYSFGMDALYQFFAQAFVALSIFNGYHKLRDKEIKSKR